MLNIIDLRPSNVTKIRTSILRKMNDRRNDKYMIYIITSPRKDE